MAKWQNEMVLAFAVIHSSISFFFDIVCQSNFFSSWPHAIWWEFTYLAWRKKAYLKQSSKSIAIYKWPTRVFDCRNSPGQPWRTQSFQLWKSPGLSCRTAFLRGWNAMISDLTVLGRFKHSAARCWKNWKSFSALIKKEPWGCPKLPVGWRLWKETCEVKPHSSFLQLITSQETQTWVSWELGIALLDASDGGAGPSQGETPLLEARPPEWDTPSSALNMWCDSRRLCTKVVS